MRLCGYPPLIFVNEAVNCRQILPPPHISDGAGKWLAGPGREAAMHSTPSKTFDGGGVTHFYHYFWVAWHDYLGNACAHATCKRPEGRPRGVAHQRQVEEKKERKKYPGLKLHLA